MSDPNPPHEDDPREMLRVLVERGAGNSADAIMLRLLWLRQEHPQAAVTTDVAHLEGGRVVMHAAISLPHGAAGSGIAAAQVEDGDDWADIVERTETIAISRALDTLGYVLRAATAAAIPTATQPPSAPESVREIRQEEPAPSRKPAPSAPAPVPAQEPSLPPQRVVPPRMDETAPSVVNALRRANRPAVSPPSSVDPAPALAEDDAHLEEYSWNTFWSRARAFGLNPDKVTEALGHPAHEVTPKEAVAGLIDAGVWPAPDND